MKKKFLHSFISLMLVAAMLPVNVFASNIEPTADSEIEIEELTDQNEVVPEFEDLTDQDEVAPELEDEIVQEEVEEVSNLKNAETPVIVDSGSCGASATWKLISLGQGASGFDEYELVISGSGSIVVGENFKGKEYLPYKVSIESGITEIGANAFSNFSNLKNINFPSSIEKIGESTFFNCNSLENISLPNSVKEIGERAFELCQNLQTIDLPASLTTIGSYAFMNCSKLQSISVPSSVTEIKEATFNNCTKLQSISLPDSITAIGNNAFFNCKSLESFTMPSSLKTIGAGCFSECENLSSVDWTKAKNLQSVGSDPFSGCKSLKELYLIPNVNYTSPIYSATGLEKLVVGYDYYKDDQMWSIFSGANQLTNLKEIVFEEGFKKIPSRLMIDNKSIKSVTIPKTVTSIGYKPFGWTKGYEVKGYTGSMAEYFAKNQGCRFTSLGNYYWGDNTGSDTLAPILTGVSVTSDKVTRPGIVKIKVDFIEEDTGVTNIQVTLRHKDSERREYAYIENASLTTGTKYLQCPLSSKAATGTWIIESIYMSDVMENNSSYYFSKEQGADYYYSDNYYGDVPTFEVVDEFDLAFESSLSNTRLVDRIKSMADGKVARVIIDKTSKGILKKDVINAIAGTNKSVVAYDDNLQWIFNGKELKTHNKDIDLNTKMTYSADAEYGFDKDNKGMKIEFADNGKLPGVVHIRYKSDYIYNRYNIKNNLDLYYVSDSGITKESSDVSVKNDGTDKWCLFDVTHNSTFIVSDINVVKQQLGFSTKSVVVNKGSKKTINFKNPSKKKVTYTTSNKKVVTVDKNGKIKAIKSGKVTITATVNKKKFTCTVKVIDPQITGKSTVKKKKTLKLKITDGYGTVTWKTSNKKIATVSKKGVVTGKKKGKVTISAKVNGKTIKKKITVK